MADPKDARPFQVTVHPYESSLEGSCAYEFGSSQSRDALVFIGGLGDGPHSVPYVRHLAAALAAAEDLSYSTFEFRLASAFGQFGFRSLAEDVRDISAFVKYLRGLGKRRIVLIGHSTGCQDCMEYAHDKLHAPEPVDGYILQAPVSDQEGARLKISEVKIQSKLAVAAEMVRNGKKDEIMPSDVVGGLFETPITAYRFESLIKLGAGDDYFSKSLSEEELTAFWGRFKRPVLVIPSGSEQYVANAAAQMESVKRWASLATPDIISEMSQLVPGATHSISEPEAREFLNGIVKRFLHSLEES